MFVERVKALIIKTAEGTSIIGIYTDDEEGNKLLDKVQRNMGRKQPDLPTKVYTFMLNTPNT